MTSTTTTTDNTVKNSQAVQNPTTVVPPNNPPAIASYHTTTTLPEEDAVHIGHVRSYAMSNVLINDIASDDDIDAMLESKKTPEGSASWRRERFIQQSLLEECRSELD